MFTVRNKTAIQFKNRSLSYCELSRHISCFANKFGQIIPGSGSKVIIFGENSIEWVISLYAIWKNDGIAIPVDVQSGWDEFTHILKDAQPDLIVVSESKKDMAELAIEEVGLQVPVIVFQNIDTHSVNQYTEEDYSPSDREKTALIVYTSGTTGSSKGVMLSFTNLYFIVNAVCNDIKIFREEFNTMMLLPVHHILPLMGSIVAPLYSGQTIHIAENLASDTILETLKQGKIAIIIGVPRLYEALAKGVMTKINSSFATKSVYKLANLMKWRWFSQKIFKTVHDKFGGHLRFLVSGGAALPVETGQVFKTLGFEILEGYGMTETAPLISFTHPGKWTVGYAGYPLRGMDFKIDNGEVVVKGANVMQGYYNRPEETAQVMHDGWFHTGDLGFLDKRGLKLTGRRKELIVTSNGKNIDPVELENKLCKISPFIQEAGVFMEHGILQAVILPDINQVRTKSVQELPEIIKNSILDFNNKVAPYKRIKRHHIISEELPKTRMGKIQRFKLSSFIQKPEIKIEQENAVHSEEYELLRTFVEKETGMTARGNDHFEIDLSMDSLSRVALWAFIEKAFGITMNEAQLNELNTLHKLEEFVKANATEPSDRKKVEWSEILTAKISDIDLPKAGLLNKTITFSARYLLRIIYRYKTRGTSNIPNEPCILVANHQSMLDGILITTSLERNINKKTYLLAKEKHWKNRVMNFMAKKNNIILMDINHNLREALQQLSYLLKNGKNVIIFPEGTRSKNGIRDFKDTFAILSKELNVPIVPVVINGADTAVSKSMILPRSKALSVDFLESVYPKQDENYQELKNRVKSMISAKFESYRESRKQKK